MKKTIEEIGDAEGSTTNVPNSNATRHLLDIRYELESERIRVRLVAQKLVEKCGLN